jgi:large subunit ribosomal protein L22
MQEFRAESRFVRVSPQKARLVLNLIKGQRVEEALNTLLFTKKRIAGQVHKILRSALDNANYLSTEKGLDVDVDGLFVKRAVANDGPRMKRIRPAPQGRAYRYQRRMAHIEIALAEKPRPEGAPPKKAAAKKAAAKKAPAKKTAAKKTAAKKTVPASKRGKK